MKAEKQELTILKDRSVLADGVNPEKDVYVFTAGKIAGPVRSIRLEVLQHESLANASSADCPISSYKQVPCPKATVPIYAKSIQLVRSEAEAFRELVSHRKSR